MGKIIMIAVSLICGFIFYGIGAFSRKSSKPATFWTGQTIKDEDITDVLAYNSECAKIWTYYSAVYFVSALLSVFGMISLAGWLIGVGGTLGIIVLIMNYIKIEKKYKVKR